MYLVLFCTNIKLKCQIYCHLVVNKGKASYLIFDSQSSTVISKEERDVTVDCFSNKVSGLKVKGKNVKNEEKKRAV